jgi:hypothetical protein
MKARILQKYGLVLMLALAPFFGGCDQQRANSATVNDTVAQDITTPPSGGQPSLDASAADANEPVATNADDELANAEGKLISTPDSASTNASNNPQLVDFTKLVQAGVGESVLMAYVTNSGAAFNISSDDIVYLNDLGTPETVITAMLQRDQYFNANGATARVTSTAPPVEPEAMAQQQQQPPIPDVNAMVQTPPLTPSPDVVEEAQQAPNGSYSYFYDSLAPYGNWIDIAGYGPCWQPTTVVVNPGWQPYCDRGHWAYTDAGWCWVSDYSWGWAPFHYGRWFRNNRYGWCWAPDTVWGPSWVSWRYSDSYCGWAPLPPAACYRPGFGFTYYGRAVGFNFGFGIGVNNFTFVSLNHFHDRYPSHYRMEHREVTKIYNTTVINNTVIRGNNNTIINRGVPVDKVARATHTEIRPIRIRAQDNGPRTAQLERNGRSLAVYRPSLPVPRAGQPPRRVGEDVKPAPQFDLHSRVERTAAVRNNPVRNTPTLSGGPQRQPIIGNPNLNRPQNDSRDNRGNRLSQPDNERPGSLIMRGPNGGDRQNGAASVRDENPTRTPPNALRRGPELQPNSPTQPDRGNERRTVTPPLQPGRDNDRRTLTPRLQPEQPTSPAFNNRPNIEQRRDDGDQLRQQRQLQQQQQQIQQQQRELQQRQRDFEPRQVIPRQEPPVRSFDVPRAEPRANPSINPGFRSEPITPRIESRPAPEIRSAPPQSAPPVRESRPDNNSGRGGGNNNQGRDDNGRGGRNNR